VQAGLLHAVKRANELAAWAAELQAADPGACCCGTAERCRAVPSCAAVCWAELHRAEQCGLPWAQSQHVCDGEGNQL